MRFHILLFHYEQLEQQLKRSTATVAALTEEKQKLDHLVLQLQSETETIGERQLLESLFSDFT